MIPLVASSESSIPGSKPRRISNLWHDQSVVTRIHIILRGGPSLLPKFLITFVPLYFSFLLWSLSLWADEVFTNLKLSYGN